MPRTNVLLITTHDINPHLGTYAHVWPGADEAITPNLDRLASEGIRFDTAFAVAPVCAPSRSAMMTGCYPTAIGTMHMRTKAVPPPEVQLLPQIFRAAGYYTTNSFFTDYQMDVPPTVFDDISPTAHWRNRPPGAPFFAQFHGMLTHESRIYLDDAEFAETIARVPVEERHDPDAVTLPPYYPDTAVFRTSWARYLDLIGAMDREVGDLLVQLDEDGLTESTLVVFVSDHGLGMPRAKRWANESGLREPLIMRWPGVIAPGSTDDGVAGLVDLAPTLLAACGLDVPAHMHGSPLFDVAGVRQTRTRYAFGGRDRMDEQEDMSRTVRDARFRYTRNYHPDRSPMQHHQYADATATWRELRTLHFEEAGQRAVGVTPDRLTDLQRRVVAATKPEHELFDIRADPHEEHNLADDPAYADDLDRLARALAAWQDEVGDLGLIPETSLVEQWRPGGVRHRVAPVTAAVSGGSVTLACDTPGASIGWMPASESLPPDAYAPNDTAAVPSPWRAMLGLDPDPRPWRIYTEPLPLAEPIVVRAWRIGFTPTDELTVGAQASVG